MLRLAKLEVLVVDCQATAAGPRGHLLELGWTSVPGATGPAHARLIKLPERARIPPAVARITGISESLLRRGVDAQDAWRELSAEASRLSQQPAPAVAHFARFEQPFLQSLSGGTPAIDLICTHEITRRLLPGLPRRTLRAVTGYFGRNVGALRRSAEHVDATAFVWQELVRLLETEGVSTWRALHEWLAVPVRAPKDRRRVWPMPRDVRLSVPDAPGLYRMLRTSGDVLYVGKASSLHHRVNSYFQKQHGGHERTLEMLSQARAVSFEVTASALEAALLEPDEIKRHRPPYNIALTTEARELWFTTPHLSARSRHATARCRVGPLPSAALLDEFAALVRGNRDALGSGRRAPDASVFAAGHARFCAAHAELSRTDLAAPPRLLRLGTRLWREGRRDGDGDQEATTATDRQPPTWTPERVQIALEWIALRAALARRRAAWFTRMVDAAIVWSEPRVDGARMIAIENGEIVARTGVDSAAEPPIPPGYRRPFIARQESFTIASFDRLRVLTTEFKRLVAEGRPLSVRFGHAPALTGARLAHVLWWL